MLDACWHACIVHDHLLVGGIVLSIAEVELFVPAFYLVCREHVYGVVVEISDEIKARLRIIGQIVSIV